MYNLNKLTLKNTLIIFVKYPQPGFVKKRLSRDIGEENAASLYRLFVHMIIDSTESNSFRRIVFFTPATRRKEFINWLGRSLEFYPQRGNDLGERLSNAFKMIFQQGARRAVVIGTDNPLIDKKIILRSFKQLKTKQCVIGPSLDGGYYLLGLSNFYKEVFKGIDWSTDRVFRQTLTLIKKLGLKFGLLKKHFDVDDISSLILLKNELKAQQDYRQAKDAKNICCTTGFNKLL